jgi:hypothetical protein
LHNASLIDEYNLWTYPVILGGGKRLFEQGAKSFALKLTATKTTKSGVVMSTYVPTGDILFDTIGEPTEPSEKELARRAKIAGE